MKPYLLVMLVLLSSLVTPVFAETITMVTDQTDYFKEDAVIITGLVDHNEHNETVNLYIFQNSSTVGLTSATVESDLTFGKVITIDEDVFTLGEVIIMAYYAETIIEITFEIIEGIHTENPPNFTLDKSVYYLDEIVYVNGTVSEISNGDYIKFTIISPNDELIESQQVLINFDKEFNAEFTIQKNIWNSGKHIINATYGEHITSKTFELLPDIIQLQTDKDTYYEESIIYVNGTMMEIDWDENTTIYYDTYDKDNNIIESLSGDYLQEDGTFLYSIVTADKPEWNKTTEVRMDVTIQNHTNTISFQYLNYPDKSPEANYDRIQTIFQLLDELKLEK